MLPIALMRVDEAAKALGRSPKTIRHYVSEGRLTAYRVGQGRFAPLRITQESVEALLEAGKVQPRMRPPAAGQFMDPQGDILSVPAPAAA